MKQFKIAVTFLSGYIGISKITSKKNKFVFTTSIIDDNFSVINIPPGAYQLDGLNIEIELF